MWGIVREFGIDMYKLRQSKWITKDLLFSTGNSPQCYVESLDGRGVRRRMDTWICMVEHIHG